MMALNDTDVFDEVEEETKEEVKETETKEETKTEKVETETEETKEKSEETKETTEETTTSEDTSTEEAGRLAALKDERRKRQGAEAELVTERHRREEAESKLKNRDIPNKDEDPEGYNTYLEGQGLRGRLEVGQEMMRDLHEDYEDTEKVFVSLIADDKGKITDDSLYNKYANARNPAKFAYDHAKKHLDLEKKSSDTYESDIRSNEREKLLAELKEKGLDGLPDLTNAAASESNTQDKEDEPGDRIDAFDD